MFHDMSFMGMWWLWLIIIVAVVLILVYSVNNSRAGIIYGINTIGLIKEKIR